MLKFKSVMCFLTAAALTLSLGVGVLADESSTSQSASSNATSQSSSSKSSSGSSHSSSTSSGSGSEKSSGSSSSESSEESSSTSSLADDAETPSEDGTGEYESSGYTDVFAYGSSQSTSEYGYVKNQLGITDDTSSTYLEVPIDLSLMESYVGDMPGIIGVWSSAYVTKGDKNSGVVVDIATPSNITRVTSNQYTNAVISSGVSDVHVGVASAAQSYGEGALAGIYVALKEMGYDLNSNVTKTAQQELNTLSEVAQNNTDNENFDDEDFNKSVASMKLEIAKLQENQMTEERVREIVNEELDKRNVEIDSADKEKLETMLTSLQSSGALDSKAVKKSLKSYMNDNKGFFARIVSSVQEFFTNVFSGGSDSKSSSSSSSEASSSESSEASSEDSSSSESDEDASSVSSKDSDSSSSSKKSTSSDSSTSDSTKTATSSKTSSTEKSSSKTTSSQIEVKEENIG